MLGKQLARSGRRVILIGAAAALMVVHAAGQQVKITNIRVEKKPGAVDGRAVATVLETVNVKGAQVTREKKGRVATHAVQAWSIMEGHGALLLLSPKKKSGLYRLRYYDPEPAKGRFLGLVPFAKANIVESQAAGGSWAFAITGLASDTGQPTIFAGDMNAVHARIDNASDPHFLPDSLAFQTSGSPDSYSIATLMGEDFRGLILAPSKSSNTSANYLQFLPNGRTLTFNANGRVDNGRWITDGPAIRVTSDQQDARPVATWQKAELHAVTGIPATRRIGVRLLEPLSSRTAKAGMEVRAVSITPAISKGVILLPQGTEFDGKITHAHGVGWGIQHETAALTVRFDTARLPDGRVLPIDAWIFQVENARESVTKDGKIQGIRSTGTIGYSAENKLTALAQVDPMAYLFLAVSGPAVLGFAEPEILYNAGTDLLIEFHAPVITAVKYERRVPRNNLNAHQMSQLEAMVKDLPYRTATEIGNKESDITNLVFIGKASALQSAFDAAGWTTSDTLTAASTFNTMKTVGGNQTYSQAPMSTLLLDGKKPLFNLQKSTNTFAARHHIRVFSSKETLDNTTVLTGSSTQDTGIAFSRKQRTFIHLIDPYLDNERSKIVNDLAFTGCVESIDMVPRPWVPRDAYNSTGDRLRTDGEAAVLYLNDCREPHITPSTVAPRAGIGQRGERNTALAVKDTVYRGNLVYQGITGGMKVRTYLAQQGELEEETGNWRKSDASGTEYKVSGASQGLWGRTFQRNQAGPVAGSSELDAAARARIRSHRWDAPHYELGLNLGYSRYRNSTLEATVVIIESSDTTKPTYVLALGDQVGDGWAAGISVTLNSWNYISNEFSYMRQQTKFDLFAFQASTDPQAEPTLDVNTVGLTTRRAAYNTVLNLRPRKSRWRPYIDAGPVLQLISISQAPLKQPSGYFRLGLSNVGLIKAAFDFAGTPPLNGGGIFQPGLQYGAGIKYRVHPRIMLRADFGETWSKNPEIIRDSYLGYVPVGLDSTYTTTVVPFKPPNKFFEQRATLGLAFTF